MASPSKRGSSQSPSCAESTGCLQRCGLRATSDPLLGLIKRSYVNWASPIQTSEIACSAKVVESLPGFFVPLFGGQGVPPGSFQAVPPHAPAPLVHEAEVVLPAGVSLLGSATKPPQGLLVVPQHSSCVEVHSAETFPGRGHRLVLQTGGTRAQPLRSPAQPRA